MAIRDWEKYSQPTLDELKIIEEKYHIKIGEIKILEKPIINKINKQINEI